ncbi:MAG: hypothetical protein AAF696_18605 [Bacteroidota bacterium]
MNHLNRTYLSKESPAELQGRLQELFLPLDADRDWEINDKKQPFEGEFNQGSWVLRPKDTTEKKMRFDLRARVVEVPNTDLSYFEVEAEARKAQKRANFWEAVYGVFLTLVVAFMEFTYDFDALIILLSIPFMLAFVFFYVQKSSRRVLDYRWKQLDHSLSGIATPY